MKSVFVFPDWTEQEKDVKHCIGEKKTQRFLNLYHSDFSLGCTGYLTRLLKLYYSNKFLSTLVCFCKFL